MAERDIAEAVAGARSIDDPIDGPEAKRNEHGFVAKARRPWHTLPPVKLFGEIQQPVQPDRLVRDLIGERTIGAIYGAPGAGKSFLALDMALHLAAGLDWFGRPVQRVGVLYIAAEAPASIENRVIAWRMHHQPAVGVQFALVPAPVDLGPEGNGGEVIADMVAGFKRAAERFRPLTETIKVVFVDTLSRTMHGGDDSKPEDMSRFVAHLDAARHDVGVAFVVVHHQGKDRDRGMRGSTHLLGAADTVIRVEKRDTVRVATVEKQRDGREGVEIPFDLAGVGIGRDDDDLPISTCVVVPIEKAPRARRPLPPAAQLGLELLHAAIAADGEIPPASRAIPANVRAVQLTIWRDRCDKAALTAADTPEAKRKAFQRVQDRLRQDGRIAIWSEWVWTVKRDD